MVKLMNQFVIIPGTERAGTTSIFNYLSKHPGICPSIVKETRFFLDEDYPLPRRFYFSEGIDKYLSLYPNRDSDSILLDATPQYMYSANTAKKIRESLSNVKFFFMLREPISRLVSKYHLSKSIGRIEKEMGFEAWINIQIDYHMRGIQADQHYLRALDQGMYSKYLEKFFSVFSYDDLRVFQFGELLQNPRKLIEDICQFIDLDPDLIDTSTLQKKHNPSMTARHSMFNKTYYGIKDVVRNILPKGSATYHFLASVYRSSRSVFNHIAMKEAADITIPNDLHKQLYDIYSEEEERIGNILGIRDFKWIS
jgi:hypothetical protein